MELRVNSPVYAWKKSSTHYNQSVKDQVQLFGILNVTPDSFSDGGKFLQVEKALAQADKLMKDGADFLDIGGESTRPDAKHISAEEEWGRIEAVLNALMAQYGAEKISLDTKNAKTAEKFLKLGGKILNDVSGCQDPRMRELVAKFTPQIIVNHFPGKTVEEVHEQEICSMNKVQDDLLAMATVLQKEGVEKEKIILDPGIGFGKTMELNWELLDFAKKVPEFQVMIGHSKKRFLGERRFEDEINLKAGRRAIESGAAFLRVHSVRGYFL